MTPRQARVALSTFILLAAGMVYNALYMQVDAPPDRRTASEAGPPGSPRTGATPSGRPRATPQGTKRTALLKPELGQDARHSQFLAR